MADDSSVDDSSEGPPWWRYGLGGFFGNPSLTAPATGASPGTSLMTPTNAAGMGPHIDPTTGQPEMLTGPGGIAEKTRGQLNPFGFLGGGNPYWRGAIAAGGVLTPSPAETGEMPRQTLGRSPSGPNNLFPPTPNGIGSDANRPVLGAGGFPTTYAAPGQQPPELGGAPSSAVGSPAPAVPPQRTTPAAAGPAAVRQQPNLGAYGAGGPFTTLDYRPNSGPNERNRGSPVATALDLSRLFGGGQPAAAAPRAVGGGAPTAANPNNPYWGPNTAGRAVGGGPIMPTDITGYPVAGVNVPAAARGFTVNPDLSTRRPRSRSSSSSQGGGY